MAKSCEICGKGAITGHRIQHSRTSGWRYKAPKSKRVFRPNIKKLELEVDGVEMKANVCMKCYKRMKKAVEEVA